MEFKIDTKDSFSIIMPLASEISANLTGALRQKCVEMRQSGSKNYIIDFHQCNGIAPEAIPGLVALHEECYSNDQSIVYTGINATVMVGLKENETDLLINVAPKMEEAIDIISMEILERDLLNEE